MHTQLSQSFQGVFDEPYSESPCPGLQVINVSTNDYLLSVSTFPPYIMYQTRHSSARHVLIFVFGCDVYIEYQHFSFLCFANSRLKLRFYIEYRFF